MWKVGLSKTFMIKYVRSEYYIGKNLKFKQERILSEKVDRFKHAVGLSNVTPPFPFGVISNIY